jgi:hypothetical protein
VVLPEYLLTSLLLQVVDQVAMLVLADRELPVAVARVAINL